MKIQFKVNRPLMPGDYILTLNPAHFRIKNVIFNDPATIIIWGDDTKTVVKCANEDYDPEKGLAMAIAKKVFGNEGNYYNVFKKWLPAKTEEIEPEPAREATPYEKAVENLKRSLLGFTFGGTGK